MARNGADLLIETAESLGVTTCFANPGTTELHLVDALGRAESMRTVLTLFEGVASGACDGFARMAGVPAIGLYHLGPGYANSLANQHNARRHNSPMINLIGDHATWHRWADSPLTSDIDLLARWTGITVAAESADDTGRAMADAFGYAMADGGRTATIVLPADAAWSTTDQSPVTKVETWSPETVDPALIEKAAAALSRPGAVIIVGGRRLGSAAQKALAALAGETGCSVFLKRTARMEQGGDTPALDDLPYFPEPLFAALAPATVAVLIGTGEPVTFFGYPDQPSSSALPAACERIGLGEENTDADATIEALATAVGVKAMAGRVEEVPIPTGPLNTFSVGQAFAAGITEGAIVMNESITAGAGLRQAQPFAPPHTHLAMLGGAIGGGLPNAIGAAVACPDRSVLALQADGSSLYTIQSLWTMARENLDITVVICANRAYRILVAELERAGMAPQGKAKPLVELDQPVVDFTSLATGFGVESEQVDTAETLIEAMGRGRNHDGPYLIEALMT